MLGSVGIGARLALSPLGAPLGFAPPRAFFAALGELAAAYLLLVEPVKRRIYRASGWEPDAPGARPRAMLQ